LGDKEIAKKALMFHMMRGMARVLLQEWGSPEGDAFTNPSGGQPIEDAILADELAAVLIVMLGQTESARQQAQVIIAKAAAGQYPVSGQSARLLSVDGARNVLDWLEEPN